MKKVAIILTILIVTLSTSLFSVPLVLGEDEPIITPPPVSPAGPVVVSGNGTHFELVSGYGTNIVLDSSQPVTIMLEYVSETIMMHVEGALGATTTDLTISGFNPGLTYYKYEDDYHNHSTVIADNEGNLHYAQDITIPHMVFIQSRPSTIYLRDTGWSLAGVGTWDAATKTGTLTRDVTETIQIDSNNITLNGNGFKVSPPVGTTNGVYFKSGIINSRLKNVTIINSSYGVNLYKASNNFVENVTTEKNGSTGIYVSYSSNGNSITNCRFTTSYNGTQLYESSNNTFNNNIFTAHSSYGVYVSFSSHNNTFNNSTITNNYNGVMVSSSNGNIFNGNTVVRNTSEYGICLMSGSNDNQFKNNIIGNNYQYGVKFFTGSSACANNLFENNLIYDHITYGISATTSGTNTYKNNVLINNSNSGIQISGSTGNLVSGNLITGSSYGIYVSSDGNTVTQNTCVDCLSYGIYLQYANSNSVNNNILRNNRMGIGLYGAYTTTNNNLVYRNRIANSTVNGIYIGGDAGKTTSNQIYNNDFISNATQAYSYVTGNIFNLAAPLGGNYFSTWTTPDSNNDGFVDNPYTITGLVGTKDNLPWSKQTGWLSFNTTDNAPFTWQKNDFTVDLACKDRNGITCGQTFYSLDGGAYQNGNSININTDGAHLITYYSTYDGVTEDTKITHALLDKTAPVITGAPVKPPFWNNWYNKDVVVRFTAIDALSGIQTVSSDVTISSEGVNQSVSGSVTDKAGNSGGCTVTGINIDKTGPVTTPAFAGTQGQGNWYCSEVQVSLSAVDAGSGVARTEYSLNGTAWMVYTAPFTLTADGLNKFYYRSIDNLGNYEAVSKTTNILMSDGFDTFTPANWPDATYLPWFSGRPQTLQGGIGIQFSGGPMYRVTGMKSTEQPPNLNKRRGINTVQTFAAGDDMVVDLASIPYYGNDGTGLVEMFLYDQSSGKYIKISADYYGYYDRRVTVAVSGFENRGSGNILNSSEWILLRIESRFGKTIFSAIDAAENVRWTTTYDIPIKSIISNFNIALSQSFFQSTTYEMSTQAYLDNLKISRTDWVFPSAEIYIDRTAPVTAASLNGTVGDDSWYRSDVTITLAAVDNVGIDKTEYSLNGTTWNRYTIPFSVGNSGETLVRYRSVDYAGNTEETKSQAVKIDKNPPTVSFSAPVPAANAAGWNNTDVTLAFTASDDFSGVDSVTPGSPLSFNMENDNQTRIVTVVDRAGNSATFTTPVIKIDKTLPTIVILANEQAPVIEATDPSGTPFTFHPQVTDNIDPAPELTISPSLTKYPLGLTKVTFMALDMAGNIATLTVNLTVQDTTPPTITLPVSEQAPVIEATNPSGTPFTFHPQVTDNGDSLPILTVAPSLLKYPLGTTRVTFTARDVSGNSTVVEISLVVKDTTPPVLTLQANEQAPVIEATDPSGTPFTFHPQVTDNGDATPNLTVTPSLTKYPLGITRVTFTVLDSSGNKTTLDVDVKVQDTTPPVITGTVTTTPNIYGWYKGDVQVHFTGTDTGSGIDTLTPDITITTEGPNQSVTGEAKDKAGNIATCTVSGINIDKTPPSLTFDTSTPAPNAAGWNNSDVSVSFTVSDDISGIATTSPAVSPVVLTAEGTAVTGTVTVADKAGNSASFTTPASKIDRTPPTITGSRNPAPNANGWNNSNVTVHFNVADSNSAIASFTPDTIVDVEGQNQSVKGTATDIAGNSASVVVSNINVDKTKPTLSFGAVTPAPNAVGWNNSDVTISYTVDDSLSGVDSLVPVSPLSFTTEGVAQTKVVTVFDKAGNTGSYTSPIVNLDKTAPVVSITSPTARDYQSTESIVVVFTTGDTISGLALNDARLDGKAVSSGQVLNLANMAGSHTFSISTVDRAGNAKTVSLTFKVIITAKVGITPSTLNLKSQSDKNAITINIALPAAYDPALIDAATVKMNVNGVLVDAQLTLQTVGMVKFDRQAVIAALGNKTGDIVITITGKLSDGRQFTGNDTLNVTNPGK